MAPSLLILYFRITYYATTATAESLYVFGGYTGGSPSRSSTIAKYSEAVWKNAGSLKQSRNSHGAITIDRKTVIIGGSGSRNGDM